MTINTIIFHIPQGEIDKPIIEYEYGTQEIAMESNSLNDDARSRTYDT